ncbi:MAG: pirin family protein [Chitinophagales bacterium]
MNKNRSVSAVLYAEEIDMGGLTVRQPFPTIKFEQIDPFLLLHHADMEVSEDIKPGDAGVGPHPHRGFSPVTFIFKGGVHHRDSRGNDSVIYEGGVQWMNAGMGIIHSERAPDNIHEIGGRQEIIQLWVNTPAKHKMDIPAYFPLTSEEMPEVVSNDQLVTLKVVAGNLFGKKGKIPTHSEVNAATINFKKGGSITIPLPETHNAVLYLLDGKINLEGYGMVEPLNAVVFKNDGEGITIEATEDTRALLITGEPLNEKVESYGPFVMNSQTEIMQAMRDYQIGKMGVLIEV